MDKYNPEYNILKTPGSPSQGPGRIFTDEHKKNISIGVKKISMSAEYIANKSRAQVNGVRVEVTDLKTNTITSYHAIKVAARALGINRSLITHFISLKQEKPVLDRYIFKLLKKKNDTNLNLQEQEQELCTLTTGGEACFKESKNQQHNIIQKSTLKLEVTDIISNKKIEYPSIGSAARDLQLRQPSISAYLKANRAKPFKGRYLIKIIKN